MLHPILSVHQYWVQHLSLSGCNISLSLSILSLSLHTLSLSVHTHTLSLSLNLSLSQRLETLLNFCPEVLYRCMHLTPIVVYPPGSFPHDHDFWIGAGDFLEEGTWIWTKSQAMIDPTATFWGPGQPSNAHQHQACLRISQNLQYKWEDGSCDSPEYFICEKQ